MHRYNQSMSSGQSDRIRRNLIAVPIIRSQAMNNVWWRHRWAHIPCTDVQIYCQSFPSIFHLEWSSRFVSSRWQDYCKFRQLRFLFIFIFWLFLTLQCYCLYLTFFSTWQSSGLESVQKGFYTHLGKSRRTDTSRETFETISSRLTAKCAPAKGTRTWNLTSGIWRLLMNVCSEIFFLLCNTTILFVVIMEYSYLYE